MHLCSETLPQRCRQSLLLPSGGPSTSHHLVQQQSCRGCCFSTYKHTYRPTHSLQKLRAQFDGNQDPRRRGPATQTYDDRELRRSQYDYPPPSAQDPRYRQPPPPDPPTEHAGGGGPDGGGPDSLTKALIGGAFVLGIGVGVWFNSEATFYPSNVASTEIIDRKTPSTELCMANGYSSMVFDQRLFVSFNP